MSHSASGTALGGRLSVEYLIHGGSNDPRIEDRLHD